MSRHVAITGGAGYIGSKLVGALLQRGNWVTVIDKLLFGGESLLAYFSHPAFHFLCADACEPGVLEDATRAAVAAGAPELSDVVHLAAIVGFPACKAAGKQTAWETNVESVGRVFHDADKLGAGRFLLSSTYSVYGIAEPEARVTEDSPLCPQSLYAESKIAAEALLLDAAHSSSCAPLIYRFATLYGISPRTRFDLIVNQFVLEAYSEGELLIFEGHHARSFVHIRDVIAGLLLGIEAPMDKIRGQIYNLGHEEGNYTKDEIANLICQVLPETVVRHEKMRFDGDMRNVQVSFEKIERELDFTPRHTVSEGIDEILWTLRHGLIADPHRSIYRNAPSILD